MYWCQYTFFPEIIVIVKIGQLFSVFIIDFKHALGNLKMILKKQRFNGDEETVPRVG